MLWDVVVHACKTSLRLKTIVTKQVLVWTCCTNIFGRTSTRVMPHGRGTTQEQKLGAASGGVMVVGVCACFVGGGGGEKAQCEV